MLYYASAGLLCTGWALVLLGCGGAFCAVWKRYFVAAAFPAAHAAVLRLEHVFFGHRPFMYHFCFRTGTTTRAMESRFFLWLLSRLARLSGAALSMAQGCAGNPTIASSAVVIQPSPEHWICWKESQVNSDSRAAFGRSRGRTISRRQLSVGGWHSYHVLRRFGRPSFAMRAFRLSEAVHEGNGPAWLATVTASRSIHRPTWAIARQQTGTKS